MFVIVNFRWDSSGHIKKKPSYQLGFHALHYVYLTMLFGTWSDFLVFLKQGRIQNLPEGGRQPKGGWAGRQSIIWANYMKIKKLGPRRGWRVSKILLCRSTTIKFNVPWFHCWIKISTILLNYIHPKLDNFILFIIFLSENFF